MGDYKFLKNDIKDLYLNCNKAFSNDNMEVIANEVINKYIECFDNQAWVDGTPWEKSQKDRGATLVDSGVLRNSIRLESTTKTNFTIISDTEYSEIHNEGGVIYITPEMRKYFWFMYSKTKDDKWKGMALTTKSVIEMPKRQFMGEDDSINDLIEQELWRILDEKGTTYVK